MTETSAAQEALPVPPLFSPACLADPYPTYAYLRRTSPVHRIATPQGFDMWLLTRYDHVRASVTDPRFSRDLHLAPPEATALTGDPDSPVNRNLLTLDPPDHTRVRKLVQSAFTGHRVKELTGRVHSVLDGVLAAAPRHEPFDLITAVAYPLPITIICELLGVPATDRDDFREWTDGLVSVAGPDSLRRLRQSQEDLLAYFLDLIRRKRARPGADLLSALIDARDGGERLSESELVGMAFMLLVAGHETTVNLIATGTKLLLTHPGQRALLERDPELLSSAVDEILRYDGPAGIAFMVAKEDVELSGATVPKGAVTAALWHAANRDPDRFEDPDSFLIERSDRAHLGFGHGIHRCIGAPLASLEARIALREMLTRFPRMRLAVEPAGLRWRPAPFFRGLEELPVVLEPR
ncbi:cytochrome P450 family protein [Wenjunlia tyrosinilytica]|uniref:Cytochrome P450 hydroxylase n=1 Tax=Wenjunlia tyrosinilytica TaxID=1544741 RepID=A0A917ZVE2_9ACTN|nr:cytochrome P450 [Wenjunlia tyrosinilytica]GGO94243.1 cytochrome P450 hydroxylase [Wenjunlia tyrosinilytica]